jgi:hypothetical protein
MEMTEMGISLMGCSTCRKVGWDISNMKRHVNSKACSGNIVQFKGTVNYTFPDFSNVDDADENIENIPPTLPSSPSPTVHESVDEQDDMEIDRPPPENYPTRHDPPRGLISPLPPRKRGRMQESLGVLMKDRISARDDGDETRIEYIFSTRGILESMLNSHIDDLPSVMFTLLYGNTSPRNFRSIFLLRNATLNQKMVYEVPREDLEPDEALEYAKATCASLTRTYAADLAKYILALAESIFLVSVPLRDNRLEIKARAYGNEISEMKNSPTPKMVATLFAALGTNISQKDD